MCKSVGLIFTKFSKSSQATHRWSSGHIDAKHPLSAPLPHTPVRQTLLNRLHSEELQYGEVCI